MLADWGLKKTKLHTLIWLQQGSGSLPLGRCSVMCLSIVPLIIWKRSTFLESYIYIYIKFDFIPLLLLFFKLRCTSFNMYIFLACIVFWQNVFRSDISITVQRSLKNSYLYLSSLPHFPCLSLTYPKLYNHDNNGYLEGITCTVSAYKFFERP